MIFEALSDAAEKGELLLVDGGLCHFHLRRDGQVTIREILVLAAYRGSGIGRRLVEQARGDARRVVARCPVDLPANGFWEHLTFAEVARSDGLRPVITWQWDRPL